MNALTLPRVYAAYVVLFLGVISGVIPREAMLIATALLVGWFLMMPLETGALFFVQSIPLFVALPLTTNFDNMNMWRPLSLVLLLRYVLEPATRRSLFSELRAVFNGPVGWFRTHPVVRGTGILLLLAALSLVGAQYPATGLMRIIYFVNLSMVPVVLWGLVRSARLTTEQVMRSIATAVIIAVVAGFIQLLSTYLLDVYQFMRLWGEEIQLRQFGTQWSYIAVWVGNTWLAYYGDQLSLRIFSLFPDSHSFPTFVLLGLPALLALGFRPIIERAHTTRLWGLMRTYASWRILWVPLAMLAAILSGTRGVWAAFVGVVILVPFWLFVMRRTRVDIVARRMFTYTALYLAVFFLLFTVAWPIFISPQFLVGKMDRGMFGNRIRSVIDFGETSNSLRIQIWKTTLVSIRRHPLLGVGIGNYPVVLEQRIDLGRAGSSAHNLYLHVAAEMGILAMLEMCVLLFAALKSVFRWFSRASGVTQVYAGALLLYLPWVLAYVMTDPILFDERVYLLFATTLALIWANDHA